MLYALTSYTRSAKSGKSWLETSASYIAAPAAVRSAIKDADIGLAIFASLGVTFPFNVLLGIPLYWQIIQYLQLTP